MLHCLYGKHSFGKVVLKNCNTFEILDKLSVFKICLEINYNS